MHEIRWERSGRSDGLPVLCLDNGEPRALVRRICSPAHYDLIIVARRGSGHAPDAGELRHNRLEDRLRDLEAVRRHLGIARWIVLGQGREGMTGLRYAQTYPDACLGLLLTGISPARQQDYDWWWQGPEALFPDVWHAFHQGETGHQGEVDLPRFRHQVAERCFSDDPQIWRPAAWAVMRYEAQIADIRVNPDRLGDLEARPDYWVAQGRLNMHYDVHHHFLAADALIDDLPRLRGIKATLLHGRYDSIMPVSGGFDLARAWPAAHFRIVPGAGHGWGDPQMYEAVIGALNSLASSLKECSA